MNDEELTFEDITDGLLYASATIEAVARILYDAADATKKPPKKFRDAYRTIMKEIGRIDQMVDKYRD